MAEQDDIVIVRTALSSPDGCRALLAAMYEPIRRAAAEYQKSGGKPLTRYEEIDNWVIPALKHIAADPCHDERLYGFILCLMGGISSMLEMSMYDLALNDLEKAQTELVGYGDDDVGMEPLEGPVMTKDRFKQIASAADWVL